MLIILDSSLENCLLDPNSREYDSLLTEINALALARRAGKLLLFCSSESLIEGLIKAPESTKTTKAVLSHLRRIMSFKKSLLKSLPIRLRLVYDGSAITLASLPTNQSEIVVPICAVPHGIFNSALFISENANDADAYIIFSRMAIASGTLALPNLLLDAETRGGGGSQVFVEYKRQKRRGDRLTICVIDGDYKYPLDQCNAWGRKMLDHDVSKPVATATSAVIPVYSIENLIPLSVLREIEPFTTPAGAHRLKEDFPIFKKHASQERWRYIPLKKGVQCKKTSGNSDEAAFWTEEIKSFGKLPSTVTCKAPLVSCKGKGCSLIPSYPDEVLENFVAMYVRELDAKKLAAAFQEIPSAVLNHLIEIIKVVVGWCCVGSPLVIASK